MTEAVLTVPPKTERSGRETALFAAVFVMSLAALLLELSLTRLFSVLLFYHFAFLAISVALLGLGAGGVFAYIKRGWLERWSTRQLAATVCLCNAVAIVGVLTLVLRVSVSLQLTLPNFLKLTQIYLLSALPFFATGLVFSVVFARETKRITGLYGADLVGASAACLTVVPLLDSVGGPNAILVAALLMAASAVIWTASSRFKVAALVMSVALAGLIAANRSGRLIDVIYTKGYKQQNIEFARWNAISRVQVEDQNGAKVISIDADANTFIVSADNLHNWKGSPQERLFMESAPAVANVLRPAGKYAIIGPGGGVDVLRAVANGSPSVTGIEINPLIANTIMRDQYLEHSAGLYTLPQVRIEVSDGRSWMRNTRERFDVIQMTLVDTWASTAAGAFALSENSLYTVNAFREYFDRLTPDGMVAITRWEFAKPREALRVVSVAMEALRQGGVTDARAHFIVVSQKPLNVDGVPVVVIAKKTPFTPGEEARVREHLARFPEMQALYLPSEEGSTAYHALVRSNDPYAFSNSYELNVAPVTDNAPFFFFTMKPSMIFSRALDRGIDWKINAAVAVLLMVFAISVLAVLAFLILPLAFATHRRPNSKPLYFFVMIGLGYILVEIAFIQRFVLFLGHPTYALTVVVFLMLLASGLGSAASRRWLADPRQVRVPILLTLAVLVLYLAVLPAILGSLVGLPFLAKLFISGAMLFPLGFAMGMPFPSGLRALAGSGEDTVEWAWALNAGASVLGSVMAMVVAVNFGLNVALATGALAYVGAFVLLRNFGSGASPATRMH